MLKLPIKKSWGAQLIIVRLAIGLVLQKIIAVKYGPVGTTLLNHFQNFIALFTQPLQDIVGQGFINGLRKAKYKQGELKAATLFFSLIILLSVATIAIIFRQHSLNTLAFLGDYWPLLISALLLLAIQLLILNYLVAKAQLKVLFFLTLLPGLLILLTLYLFTFTIESSLITYLVLQAGTVFIFIGYMVAKHPELFHLQFNLNRDVNKLFLNFIAIGITIWICSKLTDFYVRSFAISHFNALDTGHWQAVARISEAYKGLFISYLMIGLYPLLSGIKVIKKLAPLFKKYLWQYVLASGLFILLIFIFRNSLLNLLYHDDYSLQTSLYSWQLLGDLLALLSFPFSILMLAMLRTKQYIAAEIIGTTSYLAAIYLFPSNGFAVLFHAYFFRYLIYLTLVIIYTKRYWSRV